MRAFYFAAICAGVLSAACSDGRPPRQGTAHESPTGGGASDGAIDLDPEACAGPPPPEAAGFCGNQILQVLTEKPTVYFVLDGSGSMLEPFEDSHISKLVSAKLALRDLLTEIGHRIRYGASVFPDDSSGSEVCAVGTQVFPVTEGDLPLCDEKYGPVLSGFLDSIGWRKAEGGSPISASLAALMPTLLTAEPRASVMLITDGAPNCNPDAGCDADSCIPNLERQAVDGAVCGVDLDCCDPEVLGPDAASNCIDDMESERVIARLAKAGVRTFVVGMPGSETYAGVLDRLAEAGGTARSTSETSYYSVRDSSDLVGSLAAIGAEVSLDCSISLEHAPLDPSLMNVYFDSDPVDFDPENGWSYADDAIIELNGNACDVLLSGAVNQLQLVAGCPMIIK